ncbi:MAG: hypothetical protein AAF750_16000 [Planctomycetota bacterium]
MMLFVHDVTASPSGVVASTSDQKRIAQLERQVSELDRKIEDVAPGLFCAFLAGVFCALWAQNTKRNPWVWFFLGVLFHVITLLVLLYKNSRSQDAGDVSFRSPL